MIVGYISNNEPFEGLCFRGVMLFCLKMVLIDIDRVKWGFYSEYVVFGMTLAERNWIGKARFVFATDWNKNAS